MCVRQISWVEVGWRPLHLHVSYWKVQLVSILAQTRLTYIQPKIVCTSSILTAGGSKSREKPSMNLRTLRHESLFLVTSPFGTEKNGGTLRLCLRRKTLRQNGIRLGVYSFQTDGRELFRPIWKGNNPILRGLSNHGLISKSWDDPPFAGWCLEDHPTTHHPRSSLCYFQGFLEVWLVNTEITLTAGTQQRFDSSR